MGRYKYPGLDTSQYRVPNLKEETQAREFEKLRQQYTELLGRKVDDVLTTTAEELTALGMDYTYIKGKDFTFSANDELKSKSDELLDDAESEVQMLLEQYATTIGDNDSNTEQILLAYLLLLGNRNRNEQETLSMYMDRFKSDVEAAIAGMKDAGIGKTNAISLIHSNIHNIKGIPSVALAMSHPMEFQAQLIRDGGQHYDPADHSKVSGVPTSGALAVVQMTTMAMQFTWGRWQVLDFQQNGAVGYWQMRNPSSGFTCPICDAEVGLHIGTIDEPYNTHARCYSDDTEVLTNKGWVLFKDVKVGDKAMSVNPNTLNIEWIDIVDTQKFEMHGNMVHFYSMNFDMLVTEDHTIVYCNKVNDKLRFTYTAKDFDASASKQFYRSSQYVGEDVETITIGNTVVDFDLFCEFMGYWLSDGSLIRTVQINIAQQQTEPHRAEIRDCMAKMFGKVHEAYSVLTSYSKDMCTYLRQFGTSGAKYIPGEIKNASPRQIEIFLNAFAKCDGHVRYRNKAFVKPNGDIVNTTSPERSFFTTSNQMASDLCEMVVKIGHHPSMSVDKPRDSVKKDGTIIHSNKPCLHVNDRYSVCAMHIKKEIVRYDGYVYDVSLPTNHTLYVKRNGKCTWGSNCQCIRIPIYSLDAM